MARRLTNISLIVAVLFLMGGCADSREKQIAKIPQTSTDGQKAKLLDKVERKYSDAESHYELGKLYHADGLWHKAEFEFNVALGFDPLHRPAQAAMVKTLLASGSQPRSSLASEMYINQASTSAAASVMLGKAFQKELLDEYAVACYQQALAMAPNSAALHKQVGYYYLSKTDTVKAKEHLTRSIQLDPYQPEVSGELGRLGVEVRLPRKIEKNTNMLDKLLKRQAKETK